MKVNIGTLGKVFDVVVGITPCEKEPGFMGDGLHYSTQRIGDACRGQILELAKDVLSENRRSSGVAVIEFLLRVAVDFLAVLMLWEYGGGSWVALVVAIGVVDMMAWHMGKLAGSSVAARKLALKFVRLVGREYKVKSTAH